MSIQYKVLEMPNKNYQRLRSWLKSQNLGMTEGKLEVEVRCTVQLEMVKNPDSHGAFPCNYFAHLVPQAGGAKKRRCKLEIDVDKYQQLLDASNNGIVDNAVLKVSKNKGKMSIGLYL
jgi:hypothetical protein